MNDKIRELAGKALDQAVPETWTTLTAYDLNKFTEKFAELIVRECAKVAEEYDCNLSGNGGEILEHFGVEE